MSDGERGFECVLTLGTETVGIARSVDPTFSGAEQDTTTRDDAGWGDSQIGILRCNFTTEMLWVPTDTALQAIETAFLARATLAFVITSDDGYGWSGNCVVTEFHPGAQDMDNAVMCSISCVSKGMVAQQAAGS